MDFERLHHGIRHLMDFERLHHARRHHMDFKPLHQSLHQPLHFNTYKTMNLYSIQPMNDETLHNVSVKLHERHASSALLPKL